MEGYLLNDIPEPARKEMEAHFHACEKCMDSLSKTSEVEEIFKSVPRDEIQDRMRSEFLEFLEGEKERSAQKPRFAKDSRRVLIYLSIAASVAFFIIGFFSGKEVTKRSVNNDQITALKKEVQETKNLMILSMLKQTSASRRIMAVNYAEEMDVMEPELTDALFFSLNQDKSENVRLAALEVLSRYAAVQDIRSELLNSFKIQTDPIIQITLINLMVNLKEKESVPILQNLIDKEDTYEYVKAQAQQGLKLLL